MRPKHPNVIVELTGHDGNALAVMGRCCQAAKQADLPDEHIDKFMVEAMAGNYDHLLQTAMLWFNCV